MKKEILSLIGEIQLLAIKISQNTKIDVFTEYAGHVDKFEVSYFINGWSEKGGICLCKVYLDDDDLYSSEIVIAQLDKTKKELEKCWEMNL